MPKKKKQVVEESPIFQFFGKYRIFAKYDLETIDFIRMEDGSIDPSFDDYYISCSGSPRDEVHHHEENIFVLFIWSITRGNNILKALPKDVVIKHERTSSEVLIYFDGKDIDEINKVDKILTNGASIHPLDVSNLPGTYDVPEKAIEDLRLIMDKKNIQKQKRSKVYSDFITLADNENNKLLRKFSVSFIPSKEFIYKNGLWKDLLKYVNDL